MKVLLRAVLFFDALLDLLLGILLLMSPSTTLYAALQLPQPQPALFGQLLGVATIVPSAERYISDLFARRTFPDPLASS